MLMIFLVYSGGVDNTGPLWIFIVSPVSLFLLGLKRGLIEISIFFLIICFIFFLPYDIFSNAVYPINFKVRLVYVFVTVTFLSACYEYFREESYKETLVISKQYERLASTDQLTKLCNRRSVLMMMEKESSRISRNNESMSIILCDVDHFKQVNDQYGHNAGDKVLIRLGEIFTKTIREQDTVARWGGEEFLFLLPQTTAKNAEVLAHKVHNELTKESVHYEGTDIKITVSMGIAQMAANQDIHEVINQADKYLYEAKHAGRNQTMPIFNTNQNEYNV
jgi:diguanylate cyclase (GGDEF)-like protein